MEPNLFTVVLLCCEHDSYEQTATVEIQSALNKLGYGVVFIPIESPKELVQYLGMFDPKNVVILNGCGDSKIDPRNEIAILEELDALSFAFAGSDALARQITQDKIRSQRLLHAYAIPTAPWQRLDEENLRDWTIFPAIVKSAHNHSSKYLTCDSVVQDKSALAIRFDKLRNNGIDELMVTEFIEGDEFTVALWGNGTIQALPLIQMDFSVLPVGAPHICVVDWTDKATPAIKLKPVLDLAPELQDRIERVAKAAFRAIGLRDYGLVEIRLRNGTPFVIDVNADVDLASGETLAVAAQWAGYDYAGMLDRIIQLAIARINH